MKIKNINEKLFNACWHGNLDSVKHFLTSPELEEHANINYTNWMGINSLMMACWYGHLDTVKYLLTSPELKEHANIKTVDNIGRNALLYSCYDNPHLEVVKYLLTSPELKEHANLYHQDKYGWNALIYACNYEQFNIVEYLVITQNMKIDDDTIKWLKEHNYTEVTQIINARDLHHKLQSTIDAKFSGQRNKI